MARPLKGSSRIKSGNVYLRIRDHEWSVGPEADWTEAQIKAELAKIVSQIHAETWAGPNNAPQAPAFERAPLLDDLAEDYMRAKLRKGLDPNTVVDLEWRVGHVVGFFGNAGKNLRVDAIDTAAIEAYQDHKLAERAYVEEVRGRYKADPAKITEAERQQVIVPGLKGLSNASINRTLETLAAILDRAYKTHHKLMPRDNPARDKDLTLAVASAEHTSWEIDQALAILEAAAEQDAGARSDRERRIGRRPMLATLMLTGIRLDEMCGAKRSDLRLDRQQLSITDSKTRAGVRRVHLSPYLVAVLTEYLEQAIDSEWLFPSSNGGRRDPDRFRDRIQQRAVLRANQLLAERNQPLIPEHAATHTHANRRSYITWMLELGENPHWVKTQVGHTTSNLIMDLYAQQQDNRAKAHPMLKTLLGDEEESD